jgi:hypothetical protein
VNSFKNIQPCCSKPNLNPKLYSKLHKTTPTRSNLNTLLVCSQSMNSICPNVSSHASCTYLQLKKTHLETWISTLQENSNCILYTKSFFLTFYHYFFRIEKPTNLAMVFWINLPLGFCLDNYMKKHCFTSKSLGLIKSCSKTSLIHESQRTQS